MRQKGFGMRKKTLQNTLLCALIIFTAAGTAAATLEPASCGEVATWIAEHRDQLPSTLAEFETVPEGYQVGVFRALPHDLRNELWTDFLNDYVAALPEFGDARIHRILAFRAVFEQPADFADLDQDSGELLQALFSSFALRLIDPVSDLVAKAEEVGQIATLCICSFSDDGCVFAFCTPTMLGCGENNQEPCTGLFHSGS